MVSTGIQKIRKVEDKFRDRAIWASDGAGSESGLQAPELLNTFKDGGKKRYLESLNAIDEAVKKDSTGLGSRYGCKRQRLNKRAGMEYISYKQFLHGLDKGERKIFLRMFDKFECAKGRLILNGDNFAYIVGELLVCDFEKALRKIFMSGHATGDLEAMSQILTLFSRINKGARMGSPDWSDFTIHQDCEHQSILYDLIGDWLEKATSHHYGNVEPVKKLRNFMKEASFCMFTEDGRHHLIQGLPSGVRATDLFNTMVNIIFTLMADEMVKACGFEPMGFSEEACFLDSTNMHLRAHKSEGSEVRPNSLHIGDDVVCWTAKMIKLVLRYYALVAMGCRMNPSKQQMSRSKCEYLRRWIGSKSVSAYPNRAIGNMLSPPMQGKIF